MEAKTMMFFIKMEKTVNYEGENVELQIKGRHDPCIVPRAVACVEAAAAMAVIDLIDLRNRRL